MSSTNWIVPPSCQAQIVERAYLSRPVDDTAYLRITDRNAQTVQYFRADLEDELYEPWNSEPLIEYDLWSPTTEQAINRALEEV